MFKSIQVKIILIIMALAIIMLLGYSFVSINEIKSLEAIIQNKEIIEEIVRKNEIIMGIILTTFIIISIMIIGFMSKEITRPMYKLISNAKKVAEGEETQIKVLKQEEVRTEIDELGNAFDKVTKGLQENLNEVTRQKKQIETILLHMTDGIVAFDINGEILHINPAAIKLLEISNQEDTFDKIFNKFNKDINMEKMIYLENWTKTEQKINIKDKYVNMFFVPFKDENDRPAGIMVLIQDVTEHVKLDNMRKEFIADVSHELKTPLTSIMGYAETLANAEYDKDLQEKFLGVISSEAVRMTKLVSDLLTLSKHDDTNTKWEKTEFDLGELVKKCHEHLQIEIEKKKQKVECFVTANVPPVYADKDGIERVILNILSNSIKYTGENGTIKIYVGFVYNDAYIKIIDNGIGIPEKDLSRIFERFYRVDKARTRAMGGTGLRTFNCKRNIR